jgi:hypothetical protein
MSGEEKRYMECPTCYTLIAYLNGVCPECGGTGVVEEKEPQVPIIPAKGKGEQKSVLKYLGV